MMMKFQQMGVGLIEVMIGLFVLAIGLLGMASLQNNAIQLSNTSYLYSQATYLAEDIFERMRSNRDALTSYAVNFTDTPSGAKDCTSQSCTSAQLAKWDLEAWRDDVANFLPSGKGEVTIDSLSGEASVAVRFEDARGNADAADNAEKAGSMQYVRLAGKI